MKSNHGVSPRNDDAKSVTPPVKSLATSPGRLLYKVRNWDTLFENAQSRKCARLSWVPVPNKHDGKSFRRIISTENGPALYGAWMLILQVASKCPQRGVLGDEDGPLDADDLSHKTGCPADLFAVALTMLSEPRIGWLEVEPVGVEWEPAPSPLPEQSTDAGQNRMESERKRTEPTRRKKGAAVAAASVAGAAQAVDPELLDWLRWWNTLKAESLVMAGVSEREPSRAVVEAWKRCKADASLCERLRDRGAIEREIRASSFLHSAGWFRLEKLLGGRNSDGELILTKLLESSYQDRKEPDVKAHASTGSKGKSVAEYVKRNNIERAGGTTSVAEQRPTG